MSSSIASTAENLLLAEGASSTRVQLQEVVKEYGNNRVLHGIDLDIKPGEFVSLLGPSGCGKTTALRVIAGLEPATSGAVLFGGTDVSKVATNKRDIGMVFQAYSLFPHLRAVDNTAFGLRRRGVSKREAAQRAQDALDLVGLSALADRYPHELSGGQQQRVALARALVTEPKVLLLDEPLSALDAKVRVQLRDEIRRIQLRLGMTTVFVTHDQEEALAVSDRIAVMNAGRIEQIGTPEDLYRRPVNDIVASFVGLSSIARGEARGDIVEVFGVAIPLLQPQTGAVDVFLRPEQLVLTSASEGSVLGAVMESTFLGSLRRTVVRTENGTALRIQHGADEPVHFGDEVGVRVLPTPVVARARD